MLEVRGRRDIVSARALVNATGPWVGAGRARPCCSGRRRQPLRLVKGSHIVVRRLFEHDRGYIFQTTDGRVVFALPFERDFTLVGTTDEDFTGDPAARRADAGGDRLSLRGGERSFPRRDRARRRGLVVRRRALALRRRLGKPQDAPRDYVLVLDERRAAPLLTVYRRQDHDLSAGSPRRRSTKLAPVFGARPAWTAKSPLPGGDFPVDGVERAGRRDAARPGRS